MERKVPTVGNWFPPTLDYSLGRKGRARLVREEVPAGLYEHPGLGDLSKWGCDNPITLTKLQRLEQRVWKTTHVDDPPSWTVATRYAERSVGSVALVGVGLGIFVHALSRQARVKSTTVLEQDSDVLRLVGRWLPDNDVALNVIRDDPLDFLTGRGAGLFNRIIIDLWTPDARSFERILWSQAVPFTRAVRMANPEASLVVHGFGGIPERNADAVAASVLGIRKRL